MKKPLKDMLGQLRSLNATIVPVSLPSTSYALSAYYVISSAEASSNMARYDGVQYGKQWMPRTVLTLTQHPIPCCTGTRIEPPPHADLSKTANVYSHTRSQGFGREVQKRILLGTYALTAEYASYT